MIHTNIANPTLTVAIPVYNEAANIERIVREFLSTAYPNLIEVFVADGGSTDGTQDIVRKIAEQDSRVKLLHNPLKIQSAGLNLILENCQGDIFLRADAHSDYANDYIQQCVSALQDSQALNVGGSQRHVAKNSFQAGVAIAFRSFLAGTAKYHDPEYNGYSDTVYLGCFLTNALQKVVKCSPHKELFNTSQVANEDSELNLRLLLISAQAIYISSKIKVWYTPRNNPKSLFVQYFRYGRGRYLTATKHLTNAPLRTRILDILLLFYVVLFILFSFFNLVFLFLIVSFSFVFIVILFEAIRVYFQYLPTFKEEIWRGDENRLPSPFIVFISCLTALAIMPTSYIVGNIYQRCRQQVMRQNTW